MAPERFRGEGDARADIYALGLTLYELLTLRPAFDSSDRLKLIEQIKNEEPARPRSLDGRIPRDLETIVLKAIDKDPGRRYPTAEAMAEDLRRFLADEPIRARQVSASERYWRWARRNPVIAVLGGVLTAVLVAVTAASLTAASYFRDSAGREADLAEREKLANKGNDTDRSASRGRQGNRPAGELPFDDQAGRVDAAGRCTGKVSRGGHPLGGSARVARLGVGPSHGPLSAGRVEPADKPGRARHPRRISRRTVPGDRWG